MLIVQNDGTMGLCERNDSRYPLFRVDSAIDAPPGCNVAQVVGKNEWEPHSILLKLDDDETTTWIPKPSVGNILNSPPNPNMLNEMMHLNEIGGADVSAVWGARYGVEQAVAEAWWRGCFR